MFRRTLIAALLTAAVLTSTQATAQDQASDAQARLSAVEEVVERQAEIITHQQQQLNTLTSQSAAAAAAKPKEEKKEEMPSWLKDLKFSGDLRLRYEGVFADEARDANRGRFRLRFGFEKKITDGLVAGLRLASGSSADATSTNQTFTGQFGEKLIWIDLAYAVYSPPAVPGLTIGGGKVKNPFVNTDIVWDSDVNPEGAFQSYVFAASETFKPFVTLGQMFLRDNADAHDANLLAWQGGFNWNVTQSVLWTAAVTYYDFRNVENPGNFPSARGNTVAGGALTAGDFNILNVTNFVTVPIGNVPVRIFADYAKNLGEDAPAGDDGLDTAYALGFVAGKNKERGDWQIDYKYARIEANAVLGGFADSDFGGANRKGHVIGANYTLHKNVTARLAALFTEPERGPGGDQTTVHADLVFKF